MLRWGLESSSRSRSRLSGVEEFRSQVVWCGCRAAESNSQDLEIVWSHARTQVVLSDGDKSGIELMPRGQVLWHKDKAHIKAQHRAHDNTIPLSRIQNYEAIWYTDDTPPSRFLIFCLYFDGFTVGHGIAGNSTRWIAINYYYFALI